MENVFYIGKKQCGHIVSAILADDSDHTAFFVGKMFMNGLVVEKIKAATVHFSPCKCTEVVEKDSGENAPTNSPEDI